MLLTRPLSVSRVIGQCAGGGEQRVWVVGEGCAVGTVDGLANDSEVGVVGPGDGAGDVAGPGDALEERAVVREGEVDVVGAFDARELPGGWRIGVEEVGVGEEDFAEAAGGVVVEGDLAIAGLEDGLGLLVEVIAVGGDVGEAEVGRVVRAELANAVEAELVLGLAGGGDGGRVAFAVVVERGALEVGAGLGDDVSAGVAAVGRGLAERIRLAREQTVHAVAVARHAGALGGGEEAALSVVGERDGQDVGGVDFADQAGGVVLRDGDSPGGAGGGLGARRRVVAAGGGPIVDLGRLGPSGHREQVIRVGEGDPREE